MSEKLRRERKEKDEEVGRQVKGMWATSKACRASDFVNCRFGEGGACKTPGHVLKGRA